MHIMVGEITDIRGPRQKPKQLVDDALEEHFLGGHQGKSFLEGESHLITKNTVGSGSGSILFKGSALAHMTHQI